MYHMEFMVLYLAEIIIAALVLVTVSLLIRLVGMVVSCIRKIIKKGERVSRYESQRNQIE